MPHVGTVPVNMFAKFGVRSFSRSRAICIHQPELNTSRDTGHTLLREFSGACPDCPSENASQLYVHSFAHFQLLAFNARKFMW